MAGGQQAEGDVIVTLLSRVRRDQSVDPAMRRLAGTLQGLATSNPTLAMRRLKRAAELYLPGVARIEPTQALARAVPAETFFAFHTNQEAKAAFRTSADFVRFVSTSADPSLELRGFLSESPELIPWRHTWLTNLTDVDGKSAADVIRLLETNSRPPLVRFDFNLINLIDAGVTIRPPNSLDAALGEHVQWREGGPASGASEYMDGDLPLAALSGLVWLP